MAMNKSERAEMERLRKDLALAKAMRWPGYARPESVSREWINQNLEEGGLRFGKSERVARGWFYNAYLSGTNVVSAPTFGCSNGISHSSDGDVTTTQNMGRMYPTKLDALHCLRLDLTEKCARVLADVDRQIEAALSEAQP